VKKHESETHSQNSFKQREVDL